MANGTNGTSNGNHKAGGSSASSLSLQAIFYMVLLTIQFGMQPMLTKKFTPPTVCKTTVILVQETFKFCLALLMLVTSGNFNQAVKGWSIVSWLKVAAAPAFLYTIQNLAALLAYQNLDGVTFNVLNQTKTLSAALCCYLLMGREQSRVQVLALFLLLGSALVIEKIISIDFIIDTMTSSSKDAAKTDAEATSSTTTMSSQHFTHGVLPVLLASFLSGLAGAISQKNLQSATGGTSGGRNAYLFSAELCVASIIFLIGSVIAGSDDGKRIAANGFFDGWTHQTIIPIVTNATGGIIVGLVTKYAGSVRKGFSLIFGMLLAGWVQSITSIEGGSAGGISQEQIVGGTLAAISLWLHATNPQMKKKKTKEE